MEQLLADDLWPKVRKLSQKAGRVQAAVAYFSSSDNLRLRKGDLLIVDATEGAIRSAQTSARVLWQLHQAKVRLYSLRHLHAKVILIDDVALVGSANSSHSSTSLHEAGLLTDSPVVVSQLRSYLFQLSERAELLRPERLQQLKKIKVVRRGWPNGQRAKGKLITIGGRRTWIISSVDLDDDAFPKEEPLVKKAETLVRHDHPKSDPIWTRWTGQSRFRSLARDGDQIIVIQQKKTRKAPYAVSPPAALLRRQVTRAWSRFYYDPELGSRLRELNWVAFQKLVKAAAIGRKITRNTVR